MNLYTTHDECCMTARSPEPRVACALCNHFGLFYFLALAANSCFFAFKATAPFSLTYSIYTDGQFVDASTCVGVPEVDQLWPPIRLLWHFNRQQGVSERERGCAWGPWSHLFPLCDWLLELSTLRKDPESSSYIFIGFQVLDEGECDLVGESWMISIDLKLKPVALV